MSGLPPSVLYAVREDDRRVEVEEMLGVGEQYRLPSMDNVSDSEVIPYDVLVGRGMLHGELTFNVVTTVIWFVSAVGEGKCDSLCSSSPGSRPF